MRKKRKPRDELVGQANEVRLGRKLLLTEKGRFGVQVDEAKWQDPTFIAAITHTDGHYVRDGCQPSHWQHEPYRTLYTRANANRYYRGTCPQCGNHMRLGAHTIRRALDRGEPNVCRSCYTQNRLFRKEQSKARRLEVMERKREARIDTLAEIAMNREDVMLLMHAMGMTLESIGQRFGVSRARVDQIMARRFRRNNWGSDRSPDACLAVLVAFYKLTPIMLETEEGESEADAPLAGGNHAV